jgi:hypothetical protein
VGRGLGENIVGRDNVLLRYYTTAALGFSLAACGGGVPLFHGPHTLSPGTMATGVGLSGTFTTGSMRDAVTAATNRDMPTSTREDVLRKHAAIAASVAPETAPYIGGRLGLPDDNEVGLSYTGRYLRLDGRHAFESGHWALSIGGGLNASWSRLLQNERDTASQQISGSSYSLGGDVPILFGWQSDAGVVSLWGGARAGYERIVFSSSEGTILTAPFSNAVGIHHWRVGGVAGISFGFRHVHTILELETAYHGINAKLGDDTKIDLSGVTLTPAGALRFTF